MEDKEKEKLDKVTSATFDLGPSLSTPLGKAIIALAIAVLSLLAAKIDGYLKPPPAIVVVEKDKK